MCKFRADPAHHEATKLPSAVFFGLRQAKAPGLFLSDPLLWSSGPFLTKPGSGLVSGKRTARESPSPHGLDNEGAHELVMLAIVFLTAIHRTPRSSTPARLQRRHYRKLRACFLSFPGLHLIPKKLFELYLSFPRPVLKERKGTLLNYWNNFVPASEPWLAEKGAADARSSSAEWPWLGAHPVTRRGQYGDVVELLE